MIERSFGALTFSFCKRPSPRMILEDILFAATTTEIDDALFFQFPDNFNNALLSGVHVLDLHGPHQFHFFLHHLYGSTRHISEELALLLFCSSFERLRDRFFIDTLEDFANGR